MSRRTKVLIMVLFACLVGLQLFLASLSSKRQIRTPMSEKAIIVDDVHKTATEAIVTAYYRDASFLWLERDRISSRSRTPSCWSRNCPGPAEEIFQTIATEYAAGRTKSDRFVDAHQCGAAIAEANRDIIDRLEARLRAYRFREGFNDELMTRVLGEPLALHDPRPRVSPYCHRSPQKVADPERARIAAVHIIAERAFVLPASTRCPPDLLLWQNSWSSVGDSPDIGRGFTLITTLRKGCDADTKPRYWGELAQYEDVIITGADAALDLDDDPDLPVTALDLGGALAYGDGWVNAAVCEAYVAAKPGLTDAERDSSSVDSPWFHACNHNAGNPSTAPVAHLADYAAYYAKERARISVCTKEFLALNEPTIAALTRRIEQVPLGIETILEKQGSRTILSAKEVASFFAANPVQYPKNGDPRCNKTP